MDTLLSVYWFFIWFINGLSVLLIRVTEIRYYQVKCGWIESIESRYHRVDSRSPRDGVIADKARAMHG